MKKIECHNSNNFKKICKKPIISVITVNLNNCAGLKETIKSVLAQTYDNIEYIIIDGGSDDGSLEVVKEYRDSIDKYISEDDEGLFYAMNKGILMAGGEWINFMNSGDIFYSKETIQNVATKIQEGSDIVYGNWCFKLKEYDDFLIYNSAGCPEEIWKGTRFSHQALLTKSEILKENEFDCNLKVSLDYDFLLKVYYAGYKFQKVEETISINPTQGTSDINRVADRIAQMRILRCYEQRAFYDLYFIILILRAIVSSLLKKHVPKSVANLLYRFKYRFLLKYSFDK